MVLNDLDWFWSHRLPLAKAIQAQDWDLHVATAGAADDDGLTEMAVAGWDLPRHGKGSDIVGQLRLMWQLHKVIKDSQPDIIHAITIRYAFYTGLVTRLTGYHPVVFTVAGLGSLYTAPGLKAKILRAVIMPLLRFAFGGKDKFIIFQNPDDRQKMLVTKIIQKENSTVIRGSGVDIQKFLYTPYQEISAPPIILFPSRLVKEKGIEDFIAAAKILKGRGVAARFQVAGKTYPDNSRSLTEEEMQAAHDAGTIEWLGQVSDMPGLLRRAMMVVLPSYYGEGVPKVLLEAAATGRPIITCDAPGCREAVAHDGNGLLVPPQSPEALADVIESLITDVDKRAAFGQAGRKRMEEDFNTDKVVSETLGVYQKVIG